MSTLPTFPFFRDPIGQGVFERAPAQCEICNQSRGWVYTGPIYAEGETDVSICPWCIADGAAAARGYTFNDAGVLSGPPGPNRRMPKEEAAIVEGRTPGFESWQGNHWAACCGHACVYLGEAEADDLAEGGKWHTAAASIRRELAADGMDDEDTQTELLESVTKGESPSAFVFQCGTCKKLHGYVDFD